MAPTPTTQQELDALERFGKTVGSLVIIGGALTAFTRWLRRRRAAREARYAARIETIVRAAFERELTMMTGACTNLDAVSRQVRVNSGVLEAMQNAIDSHLLAGDETLGLVLDLVRENREWLDDLQSFIDHVHQIDRRSSVGQDRRSRIDDKFDAIEDRRRERRRAADRLREVAREIEVRVEEHRRNTDRGEVE